MSLEQSSLFAEGRPASPSVLPGSDRARAMTAGSGAKLCALLKSSSPLGVFSRILLESSRWASTEYWLTWKVSATPQGRLRFRLVPSTPRTSGNGCGSWRSPLGTDEKSGHGNLPHQVKKTWPTPMTWATPCSRDYRSERMSKRNRERRLKGSRGMSLPFQLTLGTEGSGSNAQTENPGALNPEFVCWLMGFPEGWLD